MGPVIDPTLDITEVDEPESDSDYDQPDKDFVKKTRRAPNAAKYERKVKNILQAGMRVTIQSPTTVADAAAILMYGPELSRTMGDLAAHDPRVRRAIDFLSDGAENPYLAVVTAAAPLVMQILRNHEPVAEIPAEKRIRIPFTKRYFSIKFRMKLGRLRNLTNEPNAFTAHVLGNPDIQAELQRQGIVVSGASDGQV